MEVKNVISNIIGQVEMLAQNVRAIDVTLGSYIEYRKDTKKFTSYLEDLGEKTKKDIEKENAKNLKGSK